MGTNIHRVNVADTNVLGRLRQVFCGLRGHDDMLQFQQHRLSLKCASCGHESPGWSLTGTPPIARTGSAVRRLTIVRPQWLGDRRVA